MLFITFQIGEDHYALDIRRVVEVLPLVKIKAIPQTVRGVAGVFNFHGKSVPVVDLTEVALGRPSQARMSTRIIVVSYPGRNGENRVVGLKAEHVTDTLRRNAEEFIDPGVKPNDAAYLGPVTLQAAQIIQQVDITQLLPDAVFVQLSQELRDPS